MAFLLGSCSVPAVPARFLLGPLGALGLARQRYRRGLAVRHVRVLPDWHAPRQGPVTARAKLREMRSSSMAPFGRRGAFRELFTEQEPYANTQTLAFKAQHHAHSLVEHGRGAHTSALVD